ncbi:MAG: hypothetical protein KBD53_07805 [Candidatus Omnitrophica bacterium]|nr:hypothetical protein [Candidatus Omnitrophota bacterium]
MKRIYSIKNKNPLVHPEGFYLFKKDYFLLAAFFFVAFFFVAAFFLTAIYQPSFIEILYL